MVSYIYHISHNDLDGVACAVVLKRTIGNHPYKHHFCDYHTMEDSINKTYSSLQGKDTLVITDTSPSAKFVKNDSEGENRLIVVDHHKTNAFLSTYPKHVLNTTKCATYLVSRHFSCAHEYVLSPDEKDFVDAVNAWDMWEVNSPHRARGENLNNILNFVGRAEFYRTFSANITADLSDPFFIKASEYIGQGKNRYVRRVVDTQVKNDTHFDDFGNTFKVFVAEDHTSYVGHEALEREECENVGYVVIVNPLSNSVSLRSNTMDVSVVASAMGGGGHKEASGFRRNIQKIIRDSVASILDGSKDFTG